MTAFAIEALNGDEPAFVSAASRVCRGALAVYAPEEIVVVRIARWFDSKWLGFMGKAFGAAGMRQRCEDDEHVIPPFVPSRVVEQVRFRRSSDGSYAEAQGGRPLHIEQMGSMNQWRTVFDVVDRDGVVVWVSGDSSAAQRGSVMLYRWHPSEALRWFASFTGERGWRPERLVGISEGELDHLASSGGSPP